MARCHANWVYHIDCLRPAHSSIAFGYLTEFNPSSLSALSCRVAGLAVAEWRGWDALEERLPAFANSGHLFPVSRGRIVPPPDPFFGGQPPLRLPQGPA